MRLLFDWDPRKAEINLAKHKVSFDQAMSVLADANALTLFDEHHSDDEDRWITLGEAAGGGLLIVVRTYVDIGVDVVLIRSISARRPTRREVGQYRQRHQA